MTCRDPSKQVLGNGKWVSSSSPSLRSGCEKPSRNQRYSPDVSWRTLQPILLIRTCDYLSELYFILHFISCNKNEGVFPSRECRLDSCQTCQHSQQDNMTIPAMSPSLRTIPSQLPRPPPQHTRLRALMRRYTQVKTLPYLLCNSRKQRQERALVESVHLRLVLGQGVGVGKSRYWHWL